MSDAKAEALEFLATLIIKTADAEGLLLSEIERRMLYFTETSRTLPKMMETAEAFERVYDQAQNEEKFVRLIAKLLTGLKKGDKGELNTFYEAVRTLKRVIDEASVRVRPALRPAKALDNCFGYLTDPVATALTRQIDLKDDRSQHHQTNRASS